MKSTHKKILILFLIAIIIIAIIHIYNRNVVSTSSDSIVYDIEENTSWTITGYGTDGDLQSMCYIIEGNNSGLVIIDGGYADDEDNLEILEEKIAANNNTVDAWILTHYDSDHAGAYMTIRDRIENMEVGKLIVYSVSSIEEYKEKLSWYDEEEWELYEKYINLDIEEKQIVYTGDEIEDIIGLRMKVLSAFSDYIDENTSNSINDGSIIFKLYGNEESILFCGDAQAEFICNYLLENYGDELQSEYLQVAHHGNNNFTDEFYEMVNPTVAFFPSPTSIMENVNNISWYRAEYLAELLQNMGATVYTFKDSPASVVLK